jgi:pyridoxamine 5'-phosphate oxidase
MPFVSGFPAETRLDEVDPDPLRQFASWLAAEEAAGVRAPEAMALATAAGGAPSLRMVLLRGFDERGFVFYTSYESRKARELEDNARAALLFHWARLGRQVRIEGRVELAGRAESEAYFATRPRGHQLAAWASRQSAPVTRDELEAAVAELERRFAGTEVPLPPTWGGYRVEPGAYEFWQHRADRLHDRFAYARQPDGAWRIERLAP